MNVGIELLWQLKGFCKSGISLTARDMSGWKPVGNVREEPLANLLRVAHIHADRLARHHRLHPGHGGRRHHDEGDDNRAQVSTGDDTKNYCNLMATDWRDLPISSELVEPQSKSLGCSVAGVHQAVTALDEGGWDDHEVEDYNGLVFWSGWQDKQPEDTQPSWHCSRHRQGDPQDTAKKGVNYAKAWLDHSFIFPGLVRSVKLWM